MWLLGWPKPQACPVQRDIFPSKCHFFPGPEAFQYLQSFLEFRHPVLTPQSYRLEFLFTVSERHPEIQTPVRDVVERRNILSHFDWVEQRQKQHGRLEAHGPRFGSEPRS